MIHRSTLSTPQPWIGYRGGGFWDVSGRIRGKGGCLFFKPPSLLLSGKAREIGLAFCSPVVLLHERGIPVFPDILSIIPPPLSLPTPWLGKQARPVNTGALTNLGLRFLC